MRLTKGERINDTPKEVKMITINLEAKMPDNLMQEFIQYIRDFDSKYGFEPDFSLVVNAPHLSANYVEKVFEKIRPPFRDVIKMEKRATS